MFLERWINRIAAGLIQKGYDPQINFQRQMIQHTIIHRSGNQANKTRQRQGQAENKVITGAELRQAGQTVRNQ